MKALSYLRNKRDLALQAANATQKQLNLVRLHEQSKKNLEQEIQNYKDEAQKQRKIIYQLEKERDRYINEASDLTQKVTSLTVAGDSLRSILLLPIQLFFLWLYMSYFSNPYRFLMIS